MSKIKCITGKPHRLCSHCSECIDCDEDILNEDEKNSKIKEQINDAKHGVLWQVNWEKDTEDGTPYNEYDQVLVPSNIPEDEVADWLSDKYGWLVSDLCRIKPEDKWTKPLKKKDMCDNVDCICKQLKQEVYKVEMKKEFEGGFVKWCYDCVLKDNDFIKDTPNLQPNPFKCGDKVRYKDSDPRVFIVYAVYSPTEVSLGLADYPDTEQDYLTNTSKIRPVKKGGKK